MGMIVLYMTGHLLVLLFFLGGGIFYCPTSSWILPEDKVGSLKQYFNRLDDKSILVVCWIETTL